MSVRQEFLFLLQVALPFALLAVVRHPGFYLPVVVILCALPFRYARRQLIKGWQGLGHLLGRIVSPVVLSGLYYLALTPLAYLRRMGGADVLQLSRPPTSTLKAVDDPVILERFDDLW